MGLIQLLIVLIIIGVALYLLQLIPMDATIRKVIYVVAIVAVLIWLLMNLSTFLPAGVR